MMDCPSDSSRLDLISAPCESIHAQSDQQINEDKLSALPDHILLDILERLDVHAAIQASTLSRRWAHLPHLLSRLRIHVAHFLPRDKSCHWSVGQVMAAYTFAVTRTLQPSSSPSAAATTIKHLQLNFYLTDPPCLRTIGHAVGSVVQSGHTECLEFTIYADILHPGYEQCVLYGQRFMSLFQECQAAFKWLTKLNLEHLTFGHTDIQNLLDTCGKIELLSLRCCDALIHPVTGEVAILTIDAPHSPLLALELTSCGYARIDLLHAPKLRRLVCVNWICENPPLSFGNVPCLDTLVLRGRALNFQTPFTLSHCLSNTTSLSTLYLNFLDQMIWIEPEGPKHLSPTFRNLKDVYLYNIFHDCDLTWTMFILEAAPSLNNFYLMLSRHPCERSRIDDIAEKVNVLWDKPSPGFKHHRLNLLQMAGFAMDEKLIKHIRLVMERAVGLKTIRLLDQHPCTKCEAIYDCQPPSMVTWRFPTEEGEKKLIRHQLLDGFSSSIEISIG